MTTNPFELRANILQMAKDFLDTQHEMQMRQVEKLADLNKNVAGYWEEATKQMPKAYTFEELMATVNKMYAFVENNERK
jgi:nicotinamide mononucleotide adenylyltransferase